MGCFVYMKPGPFSSCLGQAGSCYFKMGSRHNWDNVFHINTSSPDKKCRALIHLLLYIIIKHLFVCLTFLFVCLNILMWPLFSMSSFLINIRVFDFSKQLNLWEELKIWVKLKWRIWKSSFIHNFYQQEKIWNRLCNFVLRKAE